MMYNNMNRKNSISNTGAQGTRSRNAASGNCPGDTARTTGSGRRRKAFFALIASGVIALSGLSVFADDLKNTVPNGEVTPGTDFYTGIINTGFGPNGHTPPSPMYGPGFGPHTVDGVVQSQSTQSPTSFAAGLPLGTIFIDQTKVPEYGGVTEVVSKDNEIIAGLVLNCEGLNYTGYDGTRPGAIKLVPNKINKLNGPLFKVTFADAAVLPNGDRADLVITYSDAQIVIDER